jgi:hypothetical protein
MPYMSRVNVVLDRNYGDKMARLLPSGPIWAIDSDLNRSVTESMWKDNPKHSHLEGVTLFKSAEFENPEAVFFHQLETLDLHHGEYRILRVVGAKCSEVVQEALVNYGFTFLGVTEDGFEAVRTDL